MQNFPFPLIGYIINTIKLLWYKIPLSVKLTVLLISITAISFQYYFYPTSLFVNSTVSSTYHSTSNTTSPSQSGIAGGTIIGNCTCGKKNLPIYSVDNKVNDDNGNEIKQVSLSFDAAWGDEDTIQILDTLDKYNIKVTFFMTGGWVDAYPDKVQEIYSRGHDLGNHGENHKNMSKLSASEQSLELSKVHEKVLALTGYDMYLFRPPYGDYDNTVVTTSYSCNYYPIQWNVDSLDWKDYGAANIVKTVLNHKALCNGSIILLHNGSKFTKDALEEVIVGLQEQGYEIVPISQLIIKENFHMDTTGKQIAN